jgi:hypothetical protein
LYSSCLKNSDHDTSEIIRKKGTQLLNELSELFIVIFPTYKFYDLVSGLAACRISRHAQKGDDRDRGEDDVAVSFSIFYEKLFAELIVSFPEIAVIHL